MRDGESSETSDPNDAGLERAGGGLLRYVPRLLLALAAVGALFVLMEGNAAQNIETLEGWVEAHRVVGPIAFVVAAVLLTSLFVPDTVFAVAAGVMFGLVWGTVAIILAALATATLNFFLSRFLLRDRIEHMLLARPKLAAIRRAVSREGLSLLVLLRLTPINPVAVSYVMGTTRMHYVPFLLGTLAIVPALFVEVYGGYVIKHVAVIANSQNVHSPVHTIVTIGGLAACIVAFIYITKLAKRALAEAENEGSLADAIRD